MQRRARTGKAATPARAVLAALAVPAALAVLAGCGTGHAGAPADSPGTAPAARLAVAGSTPSKASQMVCSSEAQKEIADAVGASTTAPLAPTWSDHVYACTYTYADGRIALSVKELSDAASTTAYFTSVEARLGHGTDVAGVGQDAYQGDDGSVVVRKDYKVLDVDVSGLPAQFGTPPIDRGEAAMRVAVTVMGCWKDN